MAMYLNVVVFGILIISSEATWLDRKKCDHAKKTLRETLATTERGTDFLLNNYNLLNVDCVYGVTVAEGHIVKMLQNWQSRFPLNLKDSTLFKNIADIYFKLTEIRKLALPVIKKPSQDYSVFSDAIKTPFLYQNKFYRADLSVVYTPKYFPNSFLDKMYSCTYQLMLNYKKTKCDIPQSCWDDVIAAKTPADGYVTTHLALYLVFAEWHGCHDVLVKRAGGESKVDYFIKYFGTNIYSQALTNFHNLTTMEDLFIEQVLLSTMLGAVDSFNLDWLDHVNRWQTDYGCWKLMHTTNESWVTHVHKFTNHHDENLEDDEQSFRSRRILSDIVYDDGCSVHKSGLGLAYVASHLKFLLFPPAYESLGMKSPLGDHCDIISM